MKILVFLFFLLNLSIAVKADELLVPFSCWPKQLQDEFSKYDKKLDLNGDDRTKDSWGYLVNKGDTYVIFTYHPVETEEFKIIQEIVFKVEQENG